MHEHASSPDFWPVSQQPAALHTLPAAENNSEIFSRPTGGSRILWSAEFKDFPAVPDLKVQVFFQLIISNFLSQMVFGNCYFFMTKGG
jgi:hypothetical protein